MYNQHDVDRMTREQNALQNVCLYQSFPHKALPISST